MNLELAIYVTAFAIIGASMLLSGRWSPRSVAAREREHAEVLDALVRPLLLFTTTTPVAHC